MTSAEVPARSMTSHVVALAPSRSEDGESLEVLYADLDLMMVAEDSPADMDEMFHLASLAWADAFVTRLNRLTCQDPVTGLSSLHHLMTYLMGTFRRPGGAEDLALIVIDVVSRRNEPGGHNEATFGRTLRLAVVADTLDAWFDDARTVRVAVNSRRVAALIGWAADWRADRTAGLSSLAGEWR